MYILLTILADFQNKIKQIWTIRNYISWLFHI